MATAPAALAVEDVVKRFGGVMAVSRVSFAVPAGERHGIIGPNGAGKTTLFNLITGDLRSDGGRISMFGTDVTRLPLQRRVEHGLGRTYQITRTFPAMTVAENLALAVFGARRRHLFRLRGWRSISECADGVSRVAERFGLAGRLDVPAVDLSHGELRQLDIALAFALEPRLLLLDEPGAGLSAGERLSVRRVLKELPDDITIVMIEHNMDMLHDVVERISVLHLGSIIASGSSEEIRRDEQVQAVYLGMER